MYLIKHHKCVDRFLAALEQDVTDWLHNPFIYSWIKIERISIWAVMMMMMMIPLSQCYTVARTTMGDMTDWEKILWYCLNNCSPPIFLCSALYWELSEEKRHRGRVFCRKPPYDWLGKTKSIKSANIPHMIDYRFEFFVLGKNLFAGIISLLHAFPPTHSSSDICCLRGC